MISINDFSPKNLKVDKKSRICYIGCEASVGVKLL